MAAMLSRFRRRPGGKKLLKKSFMSFRQFTRMCDNAVGGAAAVLANAAVIIDESHEMLNERVCDREALWAGLYFFSFRVPVYPHVLAASSSLAWLLVPFSFQPVSHLTMNQCTRTHSLHR